MAIYVKFDGIEGESKDNQHPGWTEIEAFSFGAANPVSSAKQSSRVRGSVEFHDAQITKLMDKSSPKLFERVVSGKVFPKVQIEFTATYNDGSRVKYLVFELEHVLVTSYNMSGHSQTGQAASESLSLNFEAIKKTYTEYDEKGQKKGNVETTWKVGQGQK